MRMPQPFGGQLSSKLHALNSRLPTPFGGQLRSGGIPVIIFSRGICPIWVLIMAAFSGSIM